MKRNICLALLVWLAAASPGLAAENAGLPVSFEEYGFKLEIARPFEKHALPLRPGERLSEIYLTGGLAYVVKVTDLPPNSLALTVVEQTLQAEMKQAPKATRWERNSRYGELFKGIACLTKVDLNSAPWLEKITGPDTGYESVAIAPLAGESSPIVTVGIIGPRERSPEIDNLAEYLVSTVSTFKATAAESGRRKARSQAPVSKAVAARPAPKQFAKAGPTPLGRDDIELVGRVDEIKADGGSITMAVDQIRLPKEGTINWTRLTRNLYTARNCRLG